MANQTFITNETPVRLSDTEYSLVEAPLAGSQSVFLNGLLQNAGGSNDYTINQNLITFAFSVDVSDVVLVNYIVERNESDSLLSALASKKELIHWCLRKLGAPVIDINLDDDQIEDRIDEALLYFREYHFDGVERCYLHHQLTASSMILSQPYTNSITKGDILIGQTSTARGYVYDISEDNLTIRYKILNGKTFIVGETVQIEDSQNTFTILDDSRAVTVGNLDSGYVNLGSKVISVTNIIPQESSTIGGNLGGMFDFQYQFALNNMFNLASTDLVTYDLYQRYISMWEMMFRGKKGIRFNKKTDKVHFEMAGFMPDQWVIFEAWSALDANTYVEIFTDEFVREYAYNLLKMQWGQNLKKYSGISLPGGVTLNGQTIYDEAVEDLKTLRERLRSEFEFPPDFLVG